MIGLLQVLKYLATVVVAISTLGFAVVAFTFLAFCDHGPVLVCFLRGGAALSVALAQVLMLWQAWRFLKQRRRLQLAALLLILAIVPVPVAFVIFRSIPA